MTSQKELQLELSAFSRSQYDQSDEMKSYVSYVLSDTWNTYTTRSRTKKLKSLKQQASKNYYKVRKNSNIIITDYLEQIKFYLSNDDIACLRNASKYHKSCIHYILSPPEIHFHNQSLRITDLVLSYIDALLVSLDFSTVYKFLSQEDTVRRLLNVGYRAESIANGASINEKRIKKYCTKNNINMPTSAIELAEIEYILNIIPFNIKRTFPNGTIEILTL